MIFDNEGWVQAISYVPPPPSGHFGLFVNVNINRKGRIGWAKKNETNYGKSYKILKSFHHRINASESLLNLSSLFAWKFRHNFTIMARSKGQCGL